MQNDGEHDDAASDYFVWHSLDLRSLLPRDWQKSILDLARKDSRTKVIVPVSVTSREQTTDIEIPTHIVSGTTVAQDLTWLYDLYCGHIRNLAQRIFREPVSVARLPQHGIRLQIQRGADERYECHVDTVPITGLFYVTDHPVGSGGELVVANRGNIRGQEQVDADATYIHPVAGHLILFDARNHTHYVARLKLPTDFRVVVPMAFYTASCSEDTRPADLNDHLGLE